MAYICVSYHYSPSLTSSLEDIAKHIPSLRRDIKDGLLQMLSLILTGRPPTPVGSARLAFQSGGEGPCVRWGVGDVNGILNTLT